MNTTEHIALLEQLKRGTALLDQATVAIQILERENRRLAAQIDQVLRVIHRMEAWQ